TVVLILKDRQLFDDNWIYIHDPAVRVGRVQNFKSWSPEMVPDPSMACYGLEYFCFEGDGLWTRSDADLIALGKKELQQIGVSAENVWWKRLLDVQRPYRAHLRRLRLGLVLEVGCGIGRNLDHLRGTSIGVDRNRRAVEIARGRGLKAFTPEELRASPWATPGR